MKKYFSILILIFLTLPAFALQTIRGKIVDAGTQAPLDFVNVALIKQNSETPTAGVVSDGNGNFLLPNVANGKYTLRITFVGYNPIELPLNVTNNELNMGTIKLVENSKALKELEVLGQGTQMRFDIDKKVFSVDQNIASAGGSASEVLQNIPSVDVDQEGNISLRNSSSVEVWINGKPSGLTADNRAQILQQMPAESIESIEVMTNPSARFNPEGTSGIINIVLKKNRKAGYYGSVSAGTLWSQGSKPGGTLGANINYSSGKFDAYLNLGYRNMNFTGGSDIMRENYNATDTTVLNQESTMKRGFNGMFTRAGIDYRLNDKNTLSLTGFGMLGGGYSDNNIGYQFSQNNNILREYSRVNTGLGDRKSYNIALDHKYDLDKNGSNIMTSLSYSSHARNEDNTYVQKDAGSVTTSNITQKMGGGNSQWLFKIDYTQKIGENTRLEAGWQTKDETRGSPASAYDNSKNDSIKSYFNEFDYYERIHSAYMTFGSRFGNLSLQAGLRGEYQIKEWENAYYDVNNVLQNDKSNYKPALQLFPSAYLAYSLPNQNELQLNYSRRINRPRGREINPFRDYSDSTSISFGNPDLLPELTSSFEFNYLKSWDKHSLSASAYYRFTDDVRQNVRFLNNGTLENTWMNVSKSNYTGVELVAKNRLFKILNLTSSLNFYYSTMAADSVSSIYNPALTAIIPAQEMFSWSGRVMANLILGKNTSAQITGDYSSPRLIAQGSQTSSYAIDLGVRQTFLDRNLSLNLMVRDLLNSRNRNTITYGNGFYQEANSYFHGRMIGLTVTYNFGNMKPKRTERRQDTQEMDMDGME
ncbi:MAG: TonB-dependent receptor [Paludibacteraceae bacterium]|nr:TonB-dependent receptor [Paludibacteraceae bacterium]